MAGSHRSVTVLLQPDGDVKAAVRRLKKAGLENVSVLKDIGTVTGTVAHDKYAALEGIEGVQAVAPGESMKIAPPDSDVQ